MLEIITKIIIKGKSPQQIFDWMLNLNQERYLEWHPTAHKSYRRIKETENFVGSIIYFEETLGDFRVNYKWEVVDLKTDNLILMKAKIFYPVYLSLSFLATNKDTEVIHQLRIGFSFKGLEKIFDWFVRKFIFTEKKIGALERHAMEEFKNLENII